MSVNYKNPIDDETNAEMKRIFGEPLVSDELTALYDEMGTLNRKEMGALAKMAGQPVTVELNSVGDTKEINGHPWELTEAGWVRR